MLKNNCRERAREKGGMEAGQKGAAAGRVVVMRWPVVVMELG